tara:strand:- start:23 stop:457 length:435 start_codon:yes stop_codon:yes gene_type:complete
MPKKKLKKEQKNSTESTKTPSKGLGDTLEKVFKATGIKKAVHWLLGEDCGCEKRQQYLNEMFPYNRVECLKEEEYIYLDKYFKKNINTVNYETRRDITNIFNRVFNARSEVFSCGSCFQNEILNKLRKVYDKYEEDSKTDLVSE